MFFIRVSVLVLFAKSFLFTIDYIITFIKFILIFFLNRFKHFLESFYRHDQLHWDSAFNIINYLLSFFIQNFKPITLICTKIYKPIPRYKAKWNFLVLFFFHICTKGLLKAQKNHFFLRLDFSKLSKYSLDRFSIFQTCLILRLDKIINFEKNLR